MAILLVRHGETDYNRRRIVQFPDTPLSERGREQARRVAHRIAPRAVSLVLSSDYDRARSTADAIVAATSAPLEIRASLRERNLGGLRGLHHAELDADFQAPDYVPPGGESPGEFAARVDWAWAEMTEAAAATEGDTVVVTHGLVCRLLHERHLAGNGGGPCEAPAWGNTSLSVIEGPPWCATLLACTRHLDDGDGVSGAV